jgi:hypothetical protein
MAGLSLPGKAFLNGCVGDRVAARLIGFVERVFSSGGVTMLGFRRWIFCALILVVTTVPLTSAPRKKPALDEKIRQRLSVKYPDLAVVDSCAGDFLGRKGEAVALLRDSSQKSTHVIWVDKRSAKEIDSIQREDPPAELQCFTASGAKQLKTTLARSEAIHDFLKVPQDKGMFCYFVDEVTSKCWSVKAGALKEIGGWQT